MPDTIIPNHNTELYVAMPAQGENGQNEEIVLDPIVAWIITLDDERYEARPITPAGGGRKSEAIIWNSETGDWVQTDGGWGTGMDDLKKHLGIGEL